VTDFSGREWSKHSHDIVASNGTLHRKLLKKLAGATV